ncbi:phospholipase [Corallococcus sp. BB11-1]|uniref:alpha/beta hydrolase n=1 Tax=Corallococcus sp. BB11-1 TaxID=2996783 RepID=UPI0010D3FBFF|nr:phospholipase [Corallococcus sp. BB11-1]MCY1031760.1 phospholipase [Corallococcus sp. BB11-1]RYZ37165.1 MAG: phospholipase [Myxococcaceae bacterium]
MSLRPRLVRTKLGELNCHVVDALPEGAKPELVVVLGHGFGAPGTDLVGLTPELMNAAPRLAEAVRFVFPEAPLSLENLGMPHGRAWFALPESVLMGQQRDWEQFCRAVPEGMPAARRALMSTVAALQHPFGRIVLGGFSQGAMIATDVALRLEESPAGLCLLSGALVAQDEWMPKARARSALPVFQGHGRQDAVLPFQEGERLRDMLTQAGMPVEFLPFDGGHTLTTGELEQLAAFLVKRLDGR